MNKEDKLGYVQKLEAEVERLTRERDTLKDVAFQAQNAALDLIPKFAALLLVLSVSAFYWAVTTPPCGGTNDPFNTCEVKK